MVISRASWGTYAQLAGTCRELDDVRGERALHARSFENPLVHRLARAFEGWMSRDAYSAQLEAMVAGARAAFACALTTIAPTDVGAFRLFEAQKAIQLARLERSPAELRDFFVEAAGKVEGGPDIPARRVFCQHLTPRGTPSGKVIVYSPYFQGSGRSAYEQARVLADLGHHVVLMDHQWIGHTAGGKRGGFDSGHGIARDVAAVCAKAAELGQVMLLGSSMGGAAALMAKHLNDTGKMKLEGARMPVGIDAVLQAPYLGTTKSILNTTLRLASRIPFIKDIPLPAMGIPRFVFGRVPTLKTSQDAVLDDAHACLSAITGADAHVASATDEMKSARTLLGRIVIIHGREDPLASFAASKTLVTALGDSARLVELETEQHVFEHDVRFQAVAIDALQTLAHA